MACPLWHATLMHASGPARGIFSPRKAYVLPASGANRPSGEEKIPRAGSLCSVADIVLTASLFFSCLLSPRKTSPHLHQRVPRGSAVPLGVCQAAC